MTTKTKDPVHRNPVEPDKRRFTNPLPTGPDLPPWLEISASNVVTASNTSTSLSERTLTVSRVGSVIRDVYGRERVGANIVRAKVSGGNLVLVVVWCTGEVEAIERVILNGATFSGTATHYMGTAAQTGDATVAAVWGQADDLPGICYSVLTIPPGEDLALEAIIQGRKVYDPRTATTIYSENPALHLADFIDRYTDHSPNWDSVETAADRCDDVVYGQPRWAIGLSLEDRRPVSDWIKTLREYAAVFLAPDGGEIRFIPDAPASVDHALTDANVRRGSLRLKKRGLRDVPTQVEVTWTYPGAGDWRESTWWTDDPPAGTPLRVTRLQLPGFKIAGCARRKGREVYNKANLTDLECQFETFDYGLKITVGDVFSLTHPIGLTAKQFRVIEAEAIEKGRWRILGWEYDPAAYSNSTQVEPTFPDSSLPSPGDIPNGPTPTLTETLFVDEGGKTFSRWEVSWTGVDWGWALMYRVRVKTGAQVVLETTVSHQGPVAHLAVTPPIKQDQEYTAEVWVINVLGKQGASAGTATATALGKLLLPTAPTNAQGFEAGQFVNLSWSASIDIDLVGYRIKRIPKADYDGNVAGAWGHANAVLMADRHDALRILLNAQPVGTFVYMVKALDSLGQESDGVTAPYGRADTVINVTADQAGGLVLEEIDADTVVNMRRFEVHGDAVYYVTDTGDAWTDDGPATDAWTDDGAGTETWIENQTAGASSLETDEWDLGVDKDANWAWNAQITTFQGTVTQTTRFAKGADYPTFTDQGGTSFNGEARYMKALMECTGAAGDGMLIRIPVLASLQGNPLVETQTVSVPGAGSQPLAVTWTKDFVTPPKVTLTVIGSTFRQAAADNIDEDGCDLYAWDETATQAAATVEITARGV
ncbi:hypothetical protein F3N42_03620 [Marinihelvus fidelis]|uniref:Tip attachment protein J domain-containing protein n=1 Tax=Marinihelvus fidelis TaxID=2613842 RepID=A0A5N0TFQ3_9GAMM|nr:phage tail protein [Marinihelvus fidelis]KAA9133451.1 hypothetical protein F3N42_03620 [Marinihelvus fidelis]